VAGSAADPHPGGRLTVARASTGVVVRALTPADRPTLRAIVSTSWGTTRSAAHGRLIDVTEVDGLVAELDGEWIGHLMYEVTGGGACEVVLLESVTPGRGAGTALIGALAGHAIERGWSRLWLITSNDNTDALRWYQRRGFVLAALHRDAITRSRQTLKPEIPELGDDDIPIRDELELELPRSAWPDVARR
jgi:GNAT superfamily N-acetyltransferase